MTRGQGQGAGDPGNDVEFDGYSPVGVNRCDELLDDGQGRLEQARVSPHQESTPLTVSKVVGDGVGPLVESLATPQGDSFLVILGGLPRARRVLQLDDPQAVGVGLRTVTAQYLTSELDEVVDIMFLEDDEEDVEVLDGVNGGQSQPVRVAGADADEVEVARHDAS